MAPIRFLGMRGPTRRLLRNHLIALALVALVPALIFAGIVVGSLGREQRKSVERGLQGTVRALAIAVEREVEASVGKLEILATSTALDRSDLRLFYEEARRVLQAQDLWYVVALTDARGQIVLTSLHPLGTTLPSIADRGYIRDVIASGRPAVSNLIAGRTTGLLNVSFAVPVRRDGALRYILLAAIRPESFGRILAAQRIPADWIAGIADPRQVLIARNRNPEQFVGRELIEPVKEAARAAPSGFGRFPVYDAPDVYAAWQRTTALGWTVTLGAPASTVDVPLRRSMWALALGGLFATLTAGALAVALGRRISGAMSGLVSAAGALGRGATPPCPPSAIAEVHEVGQALERAGHTIRARTADLQSSQVRLKRLVDSALIGVLVSEGDRITDANDAFLHMVGYSRDELHQGKLLWPKLTPPTYDSADAAARAVARETGACPPYEKEYIRKDGSRVPVLVGPVVLDDARHEWAAFALDLTERNRLEEEWALRIQAQTANQAKDEFLAVLSHELRTPLATVLNSVRLLRRGGLGMPQAAETLDRIDRSTRLQARLVDDLLHASMILAGKLQVDKKPVVLLPIVVAAVDALRPEAEGKGVELRVALEIAPPALVLGDPERLQQIALNLIANAIKFTPSGGEVEVSLAARTDAVVLTVRDTGRGIAPELIAHVFDRFWQADVGGRQRGLGLGLTIVRHLVEAHEGTVRAESPGRDGGAIFIVELPLHISSNTNPSD